MKVKKILSFTKNSYGRSSASAITAAHQVGEKPITAAVIESDLPKRLADSEVRRTGHGSGTKTPAEQIAAKPAELRLLFRGELEPARMQELQEQMPAAGLPIWNAKVLQQDL